MKICKNCNNERNDIEFRKRKNRNSKEYILNICIYCERKQKNKSEKNRYKNLSKSEKEKINIRNREYRKSKKYKEWHKNWQKDKEKLDISFKLKRRISSLLRNSINKKGIHFQKILGYSPLELRNYLESKFEKWMNWNNWGKYNPNTWNDLDQNTWTWQIDHIKPINSFIYKKYQDEDFKKCWSLENLRPLSAKDNLLKSDKLNYDK